MARTLTRFWWLLATVASTTAHGTDQPVDTDMNYRLDTVVEQTTVRADINSTADHSKFEALQGPFEDGPAVTRACLTCHTEAGHQFMKNIHWTWEYHNEKTGQVLGKRHLVNNFCTNARGNEGMCAQCHAGYGWQDETFDFTNQEQIDCVVCHDRSGTYYKTPNSSGNEACSIMFADKQAIDYAAVAMSAGLPGRENCGGCHFYGGGGDGVKHGDLDSSLIHPDRQLDVHMDESGLNFPCTQCHVTNKHVWAGSRYDMVARDTEGAGLPGLRRDVATCESCHGLAPHPATSLTHIKLNQHVDRIACQTCHIPEIARGGVATMVHWDWRTAGKTLNGEGFKLHDYVQGNGEERATYKSIKGDFTYGENLVPEYHWFDGQMQYTTIDTQFDPDAGPVNINGFSGSADDPRSRIWPFKRMRTIMPFDAGNNTLVYTHLWGDDSDAYWGNYDFDQAIERGMEKNDKPYSGEFGFVETDSYWPITHMVAPADDALDCGDCHTRSPEGRMASIGGLYIPGKTIGGWLDRLIALALAALILGVTAHAALRIFTGSKGDHQ